MNLSPFSGGGLFFFDLFECFFQLLFFFACILVCYDAALFFLGLILKVFHQEKKSHEKKKGERNFYRNFIILAFKQAFFIFGLVSKCRFHFSIFELPFRIVVHCFVDIEYSQQLFPGSCFY